ncbi:MAG: TIGR01777 family protein [Actinobacteria bacterium]|nr:TIGR01777 family protein [Actinomycetota bacterium]
MRIAITGASGLIGSALTESLTNDGHHVLRLVRRQPTSHDEVRWDPKAGDIDLPGLAGTESIVHLAGAGVGDHRWTDDYKREIHDSRVLGTQTIARAAAELGVASLISGSAIGYYGDRGDEKLTEESTKGYGFLSDVVADWEAAADSARLAGVRVTYARTGLVVSSEGGAWKRMLPLFKAGVGGRLGSGNQYWAFISLADEVKALRFLIDNDSISGPVNLTAPEPVTNRTATEVLASELHRPAFAAVPAFALKIALGEFSSDVLGSTRAMPTRLAQANFAWDDPTMHDAVAAII